MAPTAPSKRRSIRAKVTSRATEPYAPKRAPRPDAVQTSDSFINSKRDKRHVKHASLLTRIESSSDKNRGKILKRRRPGKKLKTDLASLADALPEVLEGEEGAEALEQLAEGKIRHKSLKSRKGALKRKEKIVKGEVERFEKNLARLNAVGAAAADTQQGNGGGGGEKMAEEEHGGDGTQQQQPGTANRWAALRGFISATMEQNPAFAGK